MKRIMVLSIAPLLAVAMFSGCSTPMRRLRVVNPIPIAPQRLSRPNMLSQAAFQYRTPIIQCVLPAAVCESF